MMQGSFCNKKEKEKSAPFSCEAKGYAEGRHAPNTKNAQVTCFFLSMKPSYASSKSVCVRTTRCLCVWKQKKKGIAQEFLDQANQASINWIS